MKSSAVLVLVVLLLVLPVLCAAQGQESQDIHAPVPSFDDLSLSSTETKPKGHPKMESVLYELAVLGREGKWSEVDGYARKRSLKLRDRQIRVVLESEPQATAELISLARDMGLEVETTYQNRVQAYVPVALLLDVANLPSVRFVRRPYQAFPLAATGEGVAYIGADVWHSAGYKGQGAKVAVIDLGFKNYRTLISKGELPANVVVRSFRRDGDIEAGEVHGSACAEIIYDVAPGAQLYLINFNTDVEFGNAVDYAIAQGVQVVSCSLGWLGAGPFDGTGPICDIVNQARNNGIFWAQSAGNSANKHWEGTWADPDNDGLHNFTSNDEGQSFSVAANTTIYANLVWNDPWGASSNDYDLYLYNNRGQIVASSTDRQNGNDFPSEFIAYDVGALGGGTYHLAIRRFSATRSVHFDLYSFQQIFEHQVLSSSLLIPADAQGAVAAGAVYWVTSALEGFSSRGPTNDGRLKPEFTAPDGISSVAYSGRFYGTSAAAPHLAGAAALVRGAYPSYSAADTVAFLAGRAVDLGSVGQDNEYGYGRLSLGPAPGAPAPTATSTPSPTSTASRTPTPTRTLTPSPTPTPVGTETTVTLQQGVNSYFGSEDTFIYQYAPNSNFCERDRFLVGYNQQYAALVRFDLSPIPANATVTRATLQLYAIGWGGSNITVGAYYIIRSADLCQATWYQAQNGNRWGQPGANDTVTDRRASAESTVTTSGINKWYSFDLTAVVQGWVNSSLANNGVLLRAAYSSGLFRFASAQYGTVSLRPKLIVTYRR